MTRGQIAIIKNPYNRSEEIEVMTSIEFNGDMYMKNGHGHEVVRLLRKVHDVANYQLAVAKFNDKNHHYNDCDRLTYETTGEKAKEMLDFTKDYFKNWFSDYVYIKNLTNQFITLKAEDKNEKAIEVELEPNAIAVLCFGGLRKIYPPLDKELK